MTTPRDKEFPEDQNQEAESEAADSLPAQGKPVLYSQRDKLVAELYFLDYKHGEIAKRAGISYRTVQRIIDKFNLEKIKAQKVDSRHINKLARNARKKLESKDAVSESRVRSDADGRKYINIALNIAPGNRWFGIIPCKHPLTRVVHDYQNDRWYMRQYFTRADEQEEESESPAARIAALEDELDATISRLIENTNPMEIVQADEEEREG